MIDLYLDPVENNADVVLYDPSAAEGASEVAQPVVGSGGWASHRPRRWQMLPWPEPVVHSAAVSFSVRARFRVEADAVRAGAVVFAGMGSLAASASLTHATSVGFRESAQLRVHAQAVRVASVAYNGTGIFASVASADRAASVGFGGSAGLRVEASIRRKDRTNQNRIYQLIVYAEAA